MNQLAKKNLISPFEEKTVEPENKMV